MITLHFIGIGMGNPDHLTTEAIRDLNAADVILLPKKGADKADLADLRRQICHKVLRLQVPVVEFDLPVRDSTTGTYLDGVTDWHAAIAATWQRVICQTLPDGGTAALMIWGDPALYDSSLRIAERLLKTGMPVQVRMVPGLTSFQLLTAAHCIPLNTLGGAVTITTGRNLRDKGWPLECETMVVMLDGGCAFQTLEPAGYDIWWGAYIGMDNQILLSGTLADCGDEIIAKRAKARHQHGWIMDIYLLRKRGLNA